MENMPESKKMQITIGGKIVEIETGKYAQSATSSVTVRCEDTMLFIHSTVSKEPRVGIDFFPLLIDYEERMSAIGRIPGGFTRTEGKSSEKAILVSRLIDRPIRPLWPKGYRNDVQVVVQLFSYDQKNQPDTLAILGASTALMLSGAPFEGPVGAVRVGRIDGNFVANPTHQEAEKSDMDIVVAGTMDSVIMVEAGCKFVTEDDIMAAVEFAQVEIKKQCEAQIEFANRCGVVRENFVNPYDTSELAAIIKDNCYDIISDAYHNFDREYRKNKLDEAKQIVKDKVTALDDSHPIKAMMEETGIDFAESIETVKEQIEAEDKKEYTVALKFTPANITLNDLGLEAFPDQLATYSTWYIGSNNRYQNLVVAANKINGTVIMPGETFSYNSTVGERTIAAGFREATVFENNQAVSGLGGGICQVSTTLYNAVLYSNLDVVERTNHMFLSTYFTGGRDATVAWGSLDFKFKNNRNYPIKIVAGVENGGVHVSIYGLKTPDDYQVEIFSNYIGSGTYQTYKKLIKDGQEVSTELISTDTYHGRH